MTSQNSFLWHHFLATLNIRMDCLSEGTKIHNVSAVVENSTLCLMTNTQVGMTASSTQLSEVGPQNQSVHKTLAETLVHLELCRAFHFYCLYLSLRDMRNKVWEELRAGGDAVTRDAWPVTWSL